mmetsp:Transcript_12682/g.14278  ORF Transcript_12682/g.14278 Transcript_12682/m.14278 type:complete len:148 (+) Transcript_12682:34-477(+)|eukprot:CAMPEP_0205831022 /NCGR_PEP_ID=MMETSP0206-20130828/42780_1 /ASSEMBLY_ACC=CAM_ASM_000279 /TAXON_ID=36767 /ORGANISM="Euplotes focardii, Strain TN1" /LENGTH=147 /DNA_ID=CAMNT_0053135235 /DNA_START=34 /DNA_END=477 /DNA_ORIENTATION=+
MSASLEEEEEKLQQIEVYKGHVRRTWTLAALGPPAAALFYRHLFETAPQVVALFHGVDMSQQGDMLLNMIGEAVKLIGQPKLEAVLKAVGRRHSKYGVEESMYGLVGAALLWTLEQGLGKEWTGEVKEAWTWAYGLMSSTMIQGAQD